MPTTKSRKPKSKLEWEYWNCRIPKELGESIRKKAYLLVKAKKIKSAIKYDILQFALKQLELSLQRLEQVQVSES